MLFLRDPLHRKEAQQAQGGHSGESTYQSSATYSRVRTSYGAVRPHFQGPEWDVCRDLRVARSPQVLRWDDF